MRNQNEMEVGLVVVAKRMSLHVQGKCSAMGMYLLVAGRHCRANNSNERAGYNRGQPASMRGFAVRGGSWPC